jgi:hypothetical protein
VIREIQRSGVKSLRGIARASAARGIPTARGGMWTAVQVSDILRRMAWIGARKDMSAPKLKNSEVLSAKGDSVRTSSKSFSNLNTEKGENG